MDMNFDEMLKKVTEFISSETKTETVVGQQFTLGEFTCVPVIRVGFGFGAGGGEGDQVGKGKGSTGGAGAGMGIEPVGFLVTHAGEMNFISTMQSKGLSAALEKVPDLLAKYFENQANAKAATPPAEPVK